eukprot:CAMPEP_0116898770 /NCGR_PEP_ID=MMETSP0467-20121206/7447_1 /TAXON_ID=283647 /ORGANISM="Mesodinium pulex, Strain SPMC105" /LENGTH=59 /DNA_ID=CAMNT_0004571139 /DNA_START=425 /DNA_END=604 /DNA_ORIENTATION=+
MKVKSELDKTALELKQLNARANGTGATDATMNLKQQARNDELDDLKKALKKCKAAIDNQ